MSDRVTLPEDRDRQLRTITDRFFEREVYLSREETAAFLPDRHSVQSRQSAR